MLTFLLILVAVLITVDLLVRFVLDPFLAASRKKKKTAKSFQPRFDSSFKLATETMYDGGKQRSKEQVDEVKKEKDVTD